MGYSEEAKVNNAKEYDKSKEKEGYVGLLNKFDSHTYTAQEVPIIVLSKESFEKSRPTDLRCIDNLVTKPLDIAELVNLVKSILYKN